MNIFSKNYKDIFLLLFLIFYVSALIPFENAIIDFSKGNFGSNFGAYFGGLLSVILIFITYKEQQKANEYSKLISNFDLIDRLISRSLDKINSYYLRNISNHKASGVELLEDIIHHLTISNKDFEDSDLVEYTNKITEYLKPVLFMKSFISQSQNKRDLNEVLNVSTFYRLNEYFAALLEINNLREGINPDVEKSFIKLKFNILSAFK